MKGGVYNQGKKRWRFLATGVLFLVVLSMLVPLLFLLGIYSGFHSSSSSSSSPGFISDRQRSSNLLSELPVKLVDEVKKDIISANIVRERQQQKGARVLSPVVRQPHPRENKPRADGTAKVDRSKKNVTDGSEGLCELRYGSYCLWRDDNREDMKDYMVKKLKDQLFVARAYYPSIAKLPTQKKLSRELRQNIQELERVLSESSTDADLPPQIEKKLRKMEGSVTKAKAVVLDCNNVDKKLRQLYDMTEDEANFHMKQSAFLYQLAVQTMPKGFHCLSMRLTLECFKSSLHEKELTSDKFSDPSLQHYVIFSNNVLASSVVINSTVANARERQNLVFHVLTNEQNFYAMKFWFFRYRDAAVQVLNVEHLNLEQEEKESLLRTFLPIEFRVSVHATDNTHGAHIRTEYPSVFSHAHYLLPRIFPNFNRVVVLDDDVVVQQDLSHFWSLNLGGKVNGAVGFCSVHLNQFQSYTGENRFDKSSCAWISGLNIIDLDRWKELDLTSTFLKLEKKIAKVAGSTEVAALLASFLTFQDKVYALDDEWALSGLGNKYNHDVKDIKKAAILHYNGQMKPWLEMGIPKYKRFWRRYLNREDQLLSECNLNP